MGLLVTAYSPKPVTDQSSPKRSLVRIKDERVYERNSEVIDGYMDVYM